jgi:UDP-glucuronate decarboxylase
MLVPVITPTTCRGAGVAAGESLIAANGPRAPGQNQAQPMRIRYAAVSSPANDRPFLTMNQRILVTGGAGFLGSHLCDRLIDRGDHVICLDNFLTGHERNIRHLQASGRFELVRRDVIEPIDVRVDQIYNLACPASPPRYQVDPIHTMKTSVLGAINMLELARLCGARILHASTSEIYGDPPPEHHPQREDYHGNVNPIGPRACYDEGKRAAETLMFDYHRCHGVDIRVVRIFNTYGPRMDPNDGRVVSNFIREALSGQDITMYGDGKQTRSFCYVDELIDGLLRLMSAPQKQSGVSGPINLGNPDEFTIRELANLVIELTGSTSKIVYLPLPTDDPRQRRPDIALVQELLNWEPKVDRREGLQRTIDWFRSLGTPKE